MRSARDTISLMKHLSYATLLVALLLASVGCGQTQGAPELELTYYYLPG